ncbi:uncharacterized protein LOC133729168 [Rosa rugosa]|uniref:uncharacterized protein LOC133729168 n=1 Tax=Rosa rugosa TaxID=74645 RepID=UPI002B40F2E5|nr:uncharacterized protein LOC133729168 [Rosa rugosa]
MQCITTVRYSFLVNGQPRGYVTPTRGLRQGDPLSPYLFVLCPEGFSALLDRKFQQGQLSGISICSCAPRIHHLLFADNSLLFGNASLEECIQLQYVLSDYEEFLGVQVVAKHDKYLGLSTYVGRQKTETFAYITKRLSKKLEGWQGKLLSGAGMHLLIRVVAQALPSYAMSCFLLPKTFYDTLHQKCDKFWWGSKGDQRKIHWLSWDKLCQPKENRGMGFRDLHAHNLAFKVPNKVLWDAELTSTPSACWRGVFEALKILKKGFRWQVGDGRLIHVWDTPWLPRPCSFRPFFRYPSAPEWVHKLILPSGTWDRDLIVAQFDPDDAALILSIPLSNRQVQDRLIWHYDAKGRFTTKIAYKIAYESVHDLTLGTTTSDLNVSFWKKIWFAKIPGKVKVHIWKACSGILPTERNRRVWNGKAVWLHQLAFQAFHHLRLFQHASRAVVSSLRSRRVVVPWQPPSPGWLKDNFDGAYNGTLGKGSIGVIVRDSNGEVVGGVCKFVASISSPVEIKAFAARAACDLESQFHLAPISFEGDCLQVIQAINVGEEDTSPWGRLIDDYVSFLGQLPGASFSHVFRETNSAANKLARLALFSQVNISWYGCIPTDIRGFVTSHCML